MHRLLPLLLASTALAASGPVLEGPLSDLLSTPGLVVYELTKPATCEADGFEQEATLSWMTASEAHLVIIDRRKRKRDVPTLTGDGQQVLPMRIAYIDGTEVDRTCGCASSEELVGWMSGLQEGKTRAAQQRERLGDPEEKLEVAGEFVLARMHECADRLPEAFDVLVGLWTLIGENAPQYANLRYAQVAPQMAALARKSEDAEARLRTMRDALTLAKDDTHEALDDWIALNRALLDDDATITWYRAAIADPSLAPMALRQGPNMFYLFTSRQEWADAATTVRDLGAWTTHWRALGAEPHHAADAYAALVLAGRSKDAGKLAKEIEATGALACSLIARSTELGGTDKSQKTVAKACPDLAVVGAWEGTL